MRNEQLLSETAVNSPARLRSRWAQLLQTAAAILTRAIRPAGINQNITGPLQVAGDLVAKNPWQRAANDAVDHVQVRVAHPSRKNSQNPLGALGLKILPLLQHQWLTRGMQHRRAHEGSNYPCRCQMASHWKPLRENMPPSRPVTAAGNCARRGPCRASHTPGCRSARPGPKIYETRLGDARLVKRAPDDPSGWVCGDRQMLHDLCCRDDATMTDLEPWFPWSELDLRPPH